MVFSLVLQAWKSAYWKTESYKYLIRSPDST